MNSMIIKNSNGIHWPACAGICLAISGLCSCANDIPQNQTTENTKASPYITKVLDYRPAVGQFVNTMPEYEAGDTQETMNRKVLDAIGNNKKGLITLGGYGGYVTVGFDHTIENKTGLCDFRVLGNTFYSTTETNPDNLTGGSCEPGIILVAQDKNGNGMPDDDEWYEIAGSAYHDPSAEVWYDLAKEHGNDVNLYKNYQITYHRPTTLPTTAEEKKNYIRWEDNHGHSGYKQMNDFHNQSYFPEWIEGDRLTFTGTCLPQNGIDKSGEGKYYKLYKFGYGYADNAMNTDDASAIDIDWAIDSNGKSVHLSGVDFIRIYTGVNQENGWIGECSTEVAGVEDLHLLGVTIKAG